MLPKNTGLVHLPALMSSISRCIYVIRGHKVMLDVDLGGTLRGDRPSGSTSRSSATASGFQTDFMFRLTVDEAGP